MTDIAAFLTALHIKRAPDAPGTWELLGVLAFRSIALNNLVLVPAGFRTDFASVPRLPFAFWLFGDVAQEAGVIHDYLYSTGQVSRKLADEVFAEASKAMGVASWRRGPMWFGVRLFGGSRYAPQGK